ncbi:MAG: DUF2177 family protein [Pseudomonadota bacterium]
MEVLASYLAALVVFVILDLIWIKMIMRPIFVSDIGDLMLEDPRVTPAITFFLAYQAGIVYFAVVPAVEAGSWMIAAAHGALLGLIAYGTYETTNLATLKRWTNRMLAIDIGWGTASSAVSAVVGYAVYMAMV